PKLGQRQEEMRPGSRLLALAAKPRAPLAARAVGQLLVRLRADQHTAGRSQALEPRTGVDGVAHEWIRNVALAPDLEDDGLAAVDADAHPGPPGMLRREIGEAVL